jgi:hypothetical protein
MLTYTGDGTALDGIPARDLSDEEVKNAGGEEVLVNTGLYARPKKKPAPKPDANKEGDK